MPHKSGNWSASKVANHQKRSKSTSNLQNSDRGLSDIKHQTDILGKNPSFPQQFRTKLGISNKLQSPLARDPTCHDFVPPKAPTTSDLSPLHLGFLHQPRGYAQKLAPLRVTAPVQLEFVARTSSIQRLTPESSGKPDRRRKGPSSPGFAGRGESRVGEFARILAGIEGRGGAEEEERSPISLGLLFLRSL